MSQKSIFLHIGFHKTASSTIQVGLANNRPLLETHGYYYPRSCIVYQVAHHNAVWDLRNDHRYIPGAGRLQDLIEEIQNAPQPNSIISSEDFSFCSKHEIRNLRDRLSSVGEVQVIAYVRRQDGWLASKWAQVVKHGYCQDDFETFLEEGTDDGDFYARLEAWAAAFGRENVEPRILEPSQLSGDVLQDFLLACGLTSAAEFTAPPNQNISPGFKTLEVIRYFTGALKRNELTGPLVSEMARLIRLYADQSGWNSERPYLLTRELHERIMTQFAEPNRRLAREYFGRDELFLEPYEDHPASVYDISGLSGTEALDLLAAIIPRLQKQLRKEERIRARRFLRRRPALIEKPGAPQESVRSRHLGLARAVQLSGLRGSVGRLLRQLLGAASRR